MWTYGWNQPGYMPDETQECETWADARDALLWEVQRWDVGGFGETEAQLDSAASTLECAVDGADIEIPCGTYVLFVLRAA